MKPLDRLSEYLGAIERRLRLQAVTRGAAVTAVAALALTVVAVVVANRFAFSSGSIAGARVFLFLGLAYALAAALIVPVIRLNRRRAAREAERKFPQFEERLLTFTERVEQRPNDPFLELLAADTLSVAQQAAPREVARTAVMFSFGMLSTYCAPSRLRWTSLNPKFARSRWAMRSRLSAASVPCAGVTSAPSMNSIRPALNDCPATPPMPLIRKLPCLRKMLDEFVEPLFAAA